MAAAHNITEGEYKRIKRKLRWRRPLEIVALQFGRSVQAVLYVKHTKDWEDYCEFKRIHNMRKPESTLGKKVKEQGKRLGAVEKTMYAVGLLPKEESASV